MNCLPNHAYTQTGLRVLVGGAQNTFQLEPTDLLGR